MADYRQFHTRIWADTWFSSLKLELKLLFIYLFTNERASVCGLYELPLRIISFDTGLLREQIRQGFEIFTKADKVKYDPETSVVWVKNMLKFQSSSSPKLLARIQADIKAVPHCDLKSEALRYLADTLPIGYGSGRDTLLSVSSSVSHSVPSLDREGVQGEGQPAPPPRDDSALKAYERNIGMLTPLIAESLLDDERDYGAEWVCAAIQEAVKSEARSLKYVEAILARWKRDGFNSPRAKPSARKSADDFRAMLEQWVQE